MTLSPRSYNIKDPEAMKQMLHAFITSKHRTVKGGHFIKTTLAHSAVSSRCHTRTLNLIAPIMNGTYSPWGKLAKAREVTAETLLCLEEATRLASALPPVTYDKTTVSPINVAEIEGYMRRCRSIHKRVEAGALLLCVADGILTTHYKRGVCGRYFAVNASLQGSSRRLRAAALKGSGAADIDQKRACPTIAANILRQNGYESVAATAAAHMLRISKRCRMGYTFGANTHVTPDAVAIAFPKTPSYDNTPYWGAVVATMSRMGHVWQTNEELRTLWAREVFHIEADIQTAVEEYFIARGYFVYAHIFDGSILDKTPSEYLILQVNEHVREMFDIPAFELVVKGTF